MLRRPARRVAGLAAAVSAVVLLGGCTGSSADEVDLEGLEAGPCSNLVGTLEEVEAGLREVANEDIAPKEAAERFETVQEELGPAAASADVAVRPAVTELITQLGFFRVAVDSNNYDSSRGDEVRTALTALAKDCRGT